MMVHMIRSVSGMGIVLMAVTAATPALACGGSFCASATPDGGSARPIDQSAERILFVVHDDEPETIICAHVEIRYSGEPESFAWIVPVPSVPEVDESSSDFLDLLEQATRPEVFPPASMSCGEGTGCSCVPVTSDDSGGAGDGAYPDPYAVQVLARSMTDTYDTATLQARSAEDLVAWLEEHDYAISGNMAPAFEPYVEEGQKFLAVRVRAEPEDDTIPPLRMCYQADAPAIPLRLTAVAAQPLMGVLVMIAAREGYTPVAMDTIAPAGDELRYGADNFTLTTNYATWVARAVAERGGRLMVAEYSGPLPWSRDPTPWAWDTQRRDIPFYPEHARVISRYYTRLNPSMMTRDPVFQPGAPDLGGQSTAIDLLNRQPIYDCDRNQLVDLKPCDTMWCGLGAHCAIDGDDVGCICGQHQVAQSYPAPDGTTGVTCVPETNPLAVPAEITGDCPDSFCGPGRCVMRGGFPTCDCDADTMAMVEGDRLRCVPTRGVTLRLGPGAGAEGAVGSDDSGCDAFQMPRVASDRLIFISLTALFGLWRVNRRRKGRLSA